MKKTMIMLVMLCATVASAMDFTVNVGKDYAFGDVCLDRMGPFQVGVAAAIDFTVESESIADDFEIDFGSHYVGPIVKIHALPEDNDWSLYASYSALFENVDIDEDVYEVLGATLSYNGIGLTYQYYLSEHKRDQTPENDKLLLSWTGKF